MTDPEKPQQPSNLRFYAQIAAIIVPFIMVISGWSFSVESRLSRWDERGTNIMNLQDRMKNIENDLNDPSPKPETKVKVEAMENEISVLRSMDDKLIARMDRLEDRMNNLHFFMMYNGRKYQKGDLDPPWQVPQPPL